MTGYALLTPEFLLLFGVAWAMFAERLPGGDRFSALIGALLAGGAAVAAALAPVGGELFGGLLAFDEPARFARTGAAALVALWLLWTWAQGEGRLREAVALSLLTAVGTVMLSSARELITIVLTLELATIPAYVLIGYRRERRTGLEGALKYFLLSMLTSLVMLYGMSFLYGISATTFLDGLTADAGAIGLLAVVLTYVGLFAKLSAAPFHYWAPDAYEGAEPWTVSFVSVVPKLGGAIVLVRITEALAETMDTLPMLIAVAAAASMLLGNLAALTQTDIRRMMAYSGVAHAGYLMVGVAALSPMGYGAAVFYALAYSVPSLGVMLVAAQEGATISSLAGLAKRRPAVAWSTVAMLVSLIGIPPFVGFFGKLYVFLAALEAGLGVFVVIAVAMSAVSAAYYLRIVREMFFAEPPAEEAALAPAPSRVASGVIVACALGSAVLGIAAGVLLTALGSPLQ